VRTLIVRFTAVLCNSNTAFFWLSRNFFVKKNFFIEGTVGIVFFYVVFLQRSASKNLGVLPNHQAKSVSTSFIFFVAQKFEPQGTPLL
jgi:hypothetical protein